MVGPNEERRFAAGFDPTDTLKERTDSRVRLYIPLLTDTHTLISMLLPRRWNVT